MKKINLVIISAILFFVAFISAAKPIRASEGTFEIVSTKGTSTRCFASSVLMTNFEYKIIVSCRDLVYPPSSNAFSYVLWANPTEGEGVIKLGGLGFGKTGFKTNRAFSSMFVTVEKSGGVKAPSQNIVMRGQGKAIQFLEGFEELPVITPEEEALASPSPTPEPKRGVGSIIGASLFSIIAIIGLIGAVLFLTRRKA
jgi:hypothetical protein